MIGASHNFSMLKEGIFLEVEHQPDAQKLQHNWKVAQKILKIQLPSAIVERLDVNHAQIVHLDRLRCYYSLGMLSSLETQNRSQSLLLRVRRSARLFTMPSL